MPEERWTWAPHETAIVANLELPRTKMGHVHDVLNAITRAGLAIVPAADVPTTEERAVLEACDKFKPRSLEFWSEFGNTPELKELAQAELARRAAKW